MKKVLIIVTTGFESSGGLTTVMMNYYRNMDKSGLQIDFAATNTPGQALLEEIYGCDSKYYCLGERKKHPVQYLMNLYKLIRKEKYDVVHVNGNSATMCLDLFVSKLCKTSTRIAHGHTTRSQFPKIHRMLSPFFKRTYTDAIATSKKTGDWLFENKYMILNNAIKVEDYSYNEDIRMMVREQLGILDRFVIGNVGKLNEGKNHNFLIDVFSEIYKTRKDAVLVIAGGGHLENTLKEKCQKLGLEKVVFFLGMQDHVGNVLQAFDVFVFPSIFEGLGMALVEAQASGLSCYSSDTVPREAKVSDYVQYLSLEKGAKFWAQAILDADTYDRKEWSSKAAESIAQYGYDIKLEAQKLEKVWKGL